MTLKSLFQKSRIFSVFTIALLIAVFLPINAFAAVPTITIKEVKPGDSVTVHGSNFPQYIDFTVRMDEVGNMAIGGIVVGTVHSGTGNFDATFKIPSSLTDEPSIAIRMDGAGGWYSYNWFVNKPGTTTPTAAPTTYTGTKPRIDVIGVKADDRITVQASNFPAGQTFQIRIGPYYTFFREYVVTGTVYSGSGGDFKFTIDLPAMKSGVQLFTIRLDSPQKYYAYNAFKNITSGTVDKITSPTPAPTTTPTAAECKIISTSPTDKLSKNADFDAVWKIKNISGSTWYKNEVDYRYISGTKMYKYEKMYDLTKTVKSGETITIRVDMTAPSSAGTYSTKWALKMNKETICTLPLTIKVQN